MVIVIMGVALPPLLLLLYDGLKNSVIIQEDRVAVELSRALLEEIRGQGFINSSLYDGRLENPVTGYSDYQRAASVKYVQLAAPVEDSDLDTTVTGPTNYKRLAVTTTPAAGSPVTLVTVIVSRE